MAEPSAIVLEGLNGVGKSAVARLLCASLGVPMVRPFRHADSDRHLGHGHEGRQRDLRALAIPANTFVDDIYVADLVVAMKASAVMDRSMPSAIAYGLMYKDVRDEAHAFALVDAWQALWLKYPGRFLYVELTADSAVAAERCAGRWAPDPAQERRLKRAFDMVYRRTVLPKIQVDTSSSDASAVAAEIMEALGRAYPR